VDIDAWYSTAIYVLIIQIAAAYLCYIFGMATNYNHFSVWASQEAVKYMDFCAVVLDS
jgi:hypothetical protein